MEEPNEYKSESNYIIISKQGYNSTKNYRGNNLSQLTIKDGEHSIKLNLHTNNSNKITKSNILQTITDYRNKMSLLQKNKRNSNPHHKTYIKENIKLLEEKIINNHSKVNDMDKIYKIEQINLSKNISENDIKNDKTSEMDSNKENKTPEDTNIIMNNINSFGNENKKNKEQKENEIEENLISSMNKKSVRTLQFKKDFQKSKQISDKAEISKLNSESDNFTDLDYRLKSSLKLKKMNNESDGNFFMGGIIGANINEKEELENEIIDNGKDLMTILNNNNNNSMRNVELSKGNESNNINNINNNNNNKNLTQKRNNYFSKKESSIDKNYIIENSYGEEDLIDESEIKKDSNNNNNKEKDNSKQVEKLDINNNNNKKSEQNLIEEETSERKNLVPSIPILRKNNLKNIIIQSSKDMELNENTTKKKKVLISEINRNLIISSNATKNLFINEKNVQNSLLNNNPSVNDNNSNNSRILYKSFQYIQKDCYICEKSFYYIKLFCAECNTHFLCRKCLKNYYEEYLEKPTFSKILKCPCAKCDKTIDYEKIVKDVISVTHQKIYENQVEKCDGGLDGIEAEKGGKFEKNLTLYTKKHVLDVNNNKNIYMYKKTKDRYCPKCLKPYLFLKANNNFIKCLYCNLKICKFCLKEFTPRHLNLQAENHCKIRFRRALDEPQKYNAFVKFLIELFFVIVSYILLFPGAFLSLLNIFNKCFGINKKNKNSSYYIKMLFCWIFCGLFFIISIPFIIIIYSMFPAFFALFDY